MARAQQTIVIGVDPATGISSPMAVASFFPEGPTRLHNCEMAPPIAMRREDQRLRYLAEEVGQLLITIDEAYPDAEVHIFIEAFVMWGKAGQTLQRLIGCVMSRVPERFHFREVQNLTVKKLVAGSGRADKAQVAAAVVEYFAGDAEIARLAREGRYDTTDAYAIGIAGWKRETAGRTRKKRARR